MIKRNIRPAKRARGARPPSADKFCSAHGCTSSSARTWSCSTYSYATSIKRSREFSSLVKYRAKLVIVSNASRCLRFRWVVSAVVAVPKVRTVEQLKPHARSAVRIFVRGALQAIKRCRVVLCHDCVHALRQRLTNGSGLLHLFVFDFVHDCTSSGCAFVQPTFTNF
jgi:hypothetical protein